MLKWFSFLLLLSPLLAEAKITVTGVAGASAYNIATSATNVNPIIYGGIVGDTTKGTLCLGSSNNNEPCDGCLGATGLSACNRRRIDGDVNLSVVVSNTGSAGRAIVLDSTGSDILSGLGITIGANSSGTITTRWSTVCDKLSPSFGSVCENATSNSGTGTFKVGVDSNNNGTLDTDEYTSVTITILNPAPGFITDEIDRIDVNGTGDDCVSAAPGTGISSPGICRIHAHPGDEKFYIEDPILSGYGFPVSNGGKITGVNFYIESDFITTPAGYSPTTVSVDAPTAGDAEFGSGFIDGLTNGDKHYIRISVVDQANNEYYFTSDNMLDTDCLGHDNTTVTTPCNFMVIPDEVVGLLNKTMNCFIATAAYGSPVHPVVQDLRQFRDRFLLPYAWGRQFVNWYYDWSPKAAGWLRENPLFKPLIQALLVPIWLLTRAAMWWPLSVGLALLWWVWWRRSRMGHRRG